MRSDGAKVKDEVELGLGLMRGTGLQREGTNRELSHVSSRAIARFGNSYRGMTHMTRRARPQCKLASTYSSQLPTIPSTNSSLPIYSQHLPHHSQHNVRQHHPPSAPPHGVRRTCLPGRCVPPAGPGAPLAGWIGDGQAVEHSGQQGREVKAGELWATQWAGLVGRKEGMVGQ